MEDSDQDIYDRCAKEIADMLDAEIIRDILELANEIERKKSVSDIIKNIIFPDAQ